MIGSALFSVALATSIASTYAWYSVLEKGYISDLNMLVSADMDLLLGVKDKDTGEIIFPKSTYSKEDFGYGDGFYLHDVSGMFKEVWLNSADPETTNPEYCSAYRPFTGRYNYTSPASPKDDYLRYEFYLKSNIDCAIMLGEDTGFTPNVLSNEVVAREKGRNVEDLNKVVDATRVSFYSADGYVVAKKNKVSLLYPETSYGGLLDLNNDGYYDYDYSTNEEIVYGEYEGVPSYLDDTSGTNIPYGPDKGVFVANHKEGVKKFKEGSVEFKQENAVPFSELIFNEETMIGKPITPLLQLKAGEAKRLVMTIYLEGWDKNMTDLLSLASMDAKVSFIPLYNYKA